MLGRLKRKWLILSAALFVCGVISYALLMRIADVSLSFGGHGPNYYLLMSGTMRGFPQPRPVGEAGYFFSGGRQPLWRSLHFESEVAGGEIRELAREYMLTEGCRPAPVRSTMQSPGMPLMLAPPEATAVSGFMRGKTHFLISVSEREGGGVSVSVDEFAW
jgi:hypothetical protein